MTRAFIGFGSNIGDGPRLIQSAWKRLAVPEKVEPRKLSSLYVSEAVDMISPFPFTNAVGMVETVYTAAELLHLFFEVEEEHGRHRDGNAAGYQDRTLDLDLLYFGETVGCSSELCLPHPRVAERLFVLMPLAEIAPEFQDPATGLTAAEMLRQLVSRIEQGIVQPQPVERIDQVLLARAFAENLVND